VNLCYLPIINIQYCLKSTFVSCRCQNSAICISGFYRISPLDSIRALSLDHDGYFRLPNPLCPPYLQTLATLLLKRPSQGRLLHWSKDAACVLEKTRENENHVGGRNIKGGLNYLSTCIVFLLFSQKFSRSLIAFYFHLPKPVRSSNMQHGFTNPSYILLYFWCYYPWQLASKVH